MTQISAKDLHNLLAHTQSLDSCQDEMVKLVFELCDINSGTKNLPGIEQVADVLNREFDCLGGQANRLAINPQVDVNDQGQPCQNSLGPLIQIVKRPDIRPRMLLCIHMDTVYNAHHSFQKCRIKPDGTINGPGVADAKGGLVVMLYALKTLEQSPLANRIGWEVIINPDEELGSPGSADFLKARASDADVGLLFEPTLPDGSLVSSRKGVGNFAFVVKGKSVHSGRDFQNGRNAIVACCQIMNDIHHLNTTDDVTFNVGRINGGAALNVVPNLAIGRVNVRVATTNQMKSVQQQFQALLTKFNQLDGISVELFGQFTSPPKEITADIKQLQTRIESCAQVLGRDVQWQTTGGASDGNKFAAAGLPNIDTLGPIGGNIHSENEYLQPESLVDSARLTALVLLSYAAGL